VEEVTRARRAGGRSSGAPFTAASGAAILVASSSRPAEPIHRPVSASTSAGYERNLIDRDHP
jgi:hypothetical protein